MTEGPSEPRFICDRMVGSLCRFPRLLGYDTLNANDLPPGNLKEDTILLKTASSENRILLTRDADLAHRDQDLVLYLTGERLEDQIRDLIMEGLIVPDLRLTRCSVCNTFLIPASEATPGVCMKEVQEIIPCSPLEADKITWCPYCKKAYWEGSHTRKMREQIHQISFLREDGRTSA
ncbi:Mut7-C RNAse domain-containing protein [uncultured Methanospirillum sp.]|uniref:Mut7-C RNAse domain-containing protein n=1 Tax=uncultured Methanospirillum sp. TaxID=262503 RepID=UPI0029C6F7BA|nr:Mut7-C RNAse domain-containing protein [uncultured Methanospirillum sp.]